MVSLVLTSVSALILSMAGALAVVYGALLLRGPFGAYERSASYLKR